MFISFSLHWLYTYILNWYCVPNGYDLSTLVYMTGLNLSGQVLLCRSIGHCVPVYVQSVCNKISYLYLYLLFSNSIFFNFCTKLSSDSFILFLRVEYREWYFPRSKAIRRTVKLFADLIVDPFFHLISSLKIL